MVKTSQSLAQKSMKKFIASWKNYNLYSAFMTWKQARDGHSAAKSQIKNTVFKRLYNHLTRDAFQTWRRNLVINHHRDKKFSSNIEQENYDI